MPDKWQIYAAAEQQSQQETICVLHRTQWVTEVGKPGRRRTCCRAFWCVSRCL